MKLEWLIPLLLGGVISSPFETIIQTAYPALHTCSIPAADGGFFLSATLQRSSEYDQTLIKLNTKGEIEWAQALDGNTQGQALTQTADGGFLQAGSIDYGTGGTPLTVAKFNQSGSLQWMR